MSEFTRILESLKPDDPRASEELLPIVYVELRKLATQKMANEKPGQTLQPTALVHEAWLRLTNDTGQSWNSRGHFICAAAEAMRRILIDNARRKRRPKHGGDLVRANLDQVNLAIQTDNGTLLLIDEALDILLVEDPQKAELVKLRYYAGVTIPEAAKALGISESSAKRAWTYARAFLLREVERMQSESGF